MERCAQCGGMHEAAQECPRARRSASPAESALPDTGPYLARANLLRMRGHWAPAAEQCVDVLRLDPTNCAAHSLLGDIYQDQGQADEARHWYQLALELNPRSDADRAKLARVEEALEARQQRAEWAAVIEGRAQPLATSLLVRESLQRVGAIAGAALCGIILVMATLVSVSERTGTGVDEGTGGLLPPRKSAFAAATADTWRERALLKKTVEAAGRGPAQAVRVDLDPAGQEISIRVFLPRGAREGATTGPLRERVLREAYRWAFYLRHAAAAQREPEESTQMVQVVLVGPPGNARNSADTEFLFSGHISRNDLIVEPELVTADELIAFFSRMEPPAWGAELAI